jgi:hypothetical protein
MPENLTDREYARREGVNREVLNNLVDCLFAEAESRTRNRSFGHQNVRVSWEDGFIRTASVGGENVFKAADVAGAAKKISGAGG